MVGGWPLNNALDARVKTCTVGITAFGFNRTSILDDSHMHRSKICTFLAIPLLLASRYSEPTSDYATVTFTQTGNPQATFHTNGVDCSGMERLPGQPFYFNASAGSLKVRAANPIAFKLYQLKGMSGAPGGGGSVLKGCHVATSFTPSAGSTYRVHLDGLNCRVDVFVLSNDGGATESPERTARERKVKPPFGPKGPFCKSDI